jgi:hypothetical protein
MHTCVVCCVAVCATPQHLYACHSASAQDQRALANVVDVSLNTLCLLDMLSAAQVEIS